MRFPSFFCIYLILFVVGHGAGARDDVNATNKEVMEFREAKPSRAPASAPPATYNAAATSSAPVSADGLYPFSGHYDPEAAEQTYGTFCISCWERSHHNDLTDSGRKILQFLKNGN